MVDQGLGPATQDEAVVEALLEPAQVERVARLGGEDEAEPADVELPRRLEVGDDELDVGHAHDVERRRDPVGARHPRLSSPEPEARDRVAPRPTWMVCSSQ